eukprot:m.21752 g.21752  ORF g.21752 m.21752 type:complete len:448 (-) comp5385_c0_seq1:96-1439(-)
MAKKGFMTPKAIANRQKAKGLQKLRWYCQMCEKQCRDENGFKCHMTSESHQRQLLLVAENPQRFVHKFSKDFETTFMRLLRRRYNTRRVQANLVYQEYIADKEHLHMNSTRWTSLTEFVKHLGREGLCLVDETPKGWFIQWIEQKDPLEEAHLQKLARREAAEKTEEERQVKAIQLQMQRDRELAEERGEIQDDIEFTSLQREEGETIKFSMGDDIKPQAMEAQLPTSNPLRIESNLTEKLAAKAFGIDLTKKGEKSAKEDNGKRPKTQLQLIMEENEKRKRAKMQSEQKKKNAADDDAAADDDDLQAEESNDAKKTSKKDASYTDYWLTPDIVVKIRHKKLADGKFHKKKGYIKSLVDKYTGMVRLLDSKTSLKLDQEYLETVIPAIGGKVLFVNGPFAGLLGRLEKIHQDEFSASIKILEGREKGDIVKGKYEDFSKYLPKDERR